MTSSGKPPEMWPCEFCGVIQTSNLALHQTTFHAAEMKKKAEPKPMSRSMQKRIAAQKGEPYPTFVPVSAPKPEGDAPTKPVAELFKMIEHITGVPINMVIDAAGDPAKEAQILRHIDEKIKKEVRNGDF